MCGSHSPHANGNERLAGAALQLRYSRGAVAVEERRIGTVAAAYPRARRNAAAVYPRASCKSVVPRGFSEPRSLRCLQRSSWIQSVRQQRACTAHAPQMHRACAADASRIRRRCAMPSTVSARLLRRSSAGWVRVHREPTRAGTRLGTVREAWLDAQRCADTWSAALAASGWPRR